MKKIKYTPDAADKLRELKRAISQQYGANKANQIVKTITDAIRGLYDKEKKSKEISQTIDVDKE